MSIGKGLQTLIFVRRGVAYCSAVARATAALLGRFLPSLGPLASARGPFFLLFGSRPVRPQLSQGNVGQSPRQSLQIGRQVVEGGRPLVTPLIHVKGSVDLELDCV